MVMKAGSRISPLCSPSYYLQYVIGLCDESIDQERLLKIANALIGEFWEESTSLLYAPSTIAISAIIVALSVMNVNCESFLDKIPDYFFPGYSNDFFVESEVDQKSKFLDCDACVKALEKVPSMRTTSNTRSPASIADAENLHVFTSVSMDAFQK